MGIAAVVELCGVNALAFAVGAYLPLSTTTPIFIGGAINWLVDRKKKTTVEESETGPGALFSSGLIAGGALTGILIAVMIGANAGTNPDGSPRSLISVFNTGIADRMGAWSDLVALIAFGILSWILYRFAVSKSATLPPAGVPDHLRDLSEEDN
jgi:hypothetical protein